MPDQRKWGYDLQAIADAAKLSIHTVRDHKEKGQLRPDDLRAVALYVMGNYLRWTTQHPDAARREMIREDRDYDKVWGDESGKKEKH
jgi:hypothetical protein